MPTPKIQRKPPSRVSGVATHWILWINPGAAKCDNILKGQNDSHVELLCFRL